MITQELIRPSSIVVVGASSNIAKPGGKVLYNLKRGTFKGKLYAVNPKNENVQDVHTYTSISELPRVDLAILAIPAKFCLTTVDILIKEKNTKAIIVLSAGFSETSEIGKDLEQKMVDLVEHAGVTLIGPNCIGVMNTHYQGVFTTPVPRLTNEGCTFISSSGATAVFIMETALKKGLHFSSVFSVGNASHTCVEDILEYCAKTYDQANKPKTLMLYMETIKKPLVLLKSAQDLVNKGYSIAAIKSGTSDAGSRAAASHTGAMLNSDMAVDALFRKAGIIRCYSREELATVGSVLQHKHLNGKNIAIITHAGGPAVMLTDSLSNRGMAVPNIPKSSTVNLLEELFEGSSVANPIDILATGTATQLEKVITFCEENLKIIDGIVVIFGSPGLFSVTDAYDVIIKQQKKCCKPIYAVMPSVMNCKEEMENFAKKGGVFFEDEVSLGCAVAKVYHQPKPNTYRAIKNKKAKEIKKILKNKTGLLPLDDALKILDLADIKRPNELLVYSEREAIKAAQDIGFPLVMKVVGPAHKSEVGGVVLDIDNINEVKLIFAKLNAIDGAEGVQVSKMEKGLEIFIGVKKEADFGHIITCGLGGIFVEVLKDIQYNLSPVSKQEALAMIRSLQCYPLVRGIRGKEGIEEELIVETICKVSSLLEIAPEITEMDINPLIGRGKHLVAVDVVINL